MKTTLIRFAALATLGLAACQGVEQGMAPTLDTRPALLASVAAPTSVTVVDLGRWNSACTDLGYSFGFKVDRSGTAVTGTWQVGSYGSVTLASTDGISFNWTSTFPVDAVVAKGGTQGANVFRYVPQATGGDRLAPPANYNRQKNTYTATPAGISHVDFCFNINLGVSATARTGYTRTFAWTIAKASATDALTVEQGQATPAVGYTVTLGSTSTDADWNVDGTVTLANPAWFPATVTSLTDVVTTDLAAALTCPATPFVVPAGASVSCTYTRALPNADVRSNVATAQTDLASTFSAPASTVAGTAFYGRGAVRGGSATAAVVFGDPTNLVDEQVTVTDSRTGALGILNAADATKRFSYDLTFGPYMQCGTTVTEANTATFRTNDTQAAGSASRNVAVTVTCAPPPPPPPSTDNRCTLSQGYWSTHSENGPAPYNATWARLPSGASTTFYLSGTSWYNVFQTAPVGNVYYILAHQFMGATLNDLKGSTVPANVASALTSATALFNTTTPAQAAVLSTSAKAQWTALAALLESYNTGTLAGGPAHCSE